MTIKEILNDYKYTDFLESLDPSIKNSINSLHESGVSLETIGTEIANMPSIGLTTKGVNKWDKNIFQKVLSEVAVLICNESNETELVKKLKSEAGMSTQIIIAGVSHYVGDKLGFAYALCVPFVILSLAIILKAGINVFCKSYRN
ncbi:MAG: hypothetical protein ACOCQ4_02070 [bacterium]